MIPHHRLATLSLLRQLENAGKRVIVWTVNNPASMLQFRDRGVDGIISDDAELLCQTVSATTGSI